MTMSEPVAAERLATALERAGLMGGNVEYGSDGRWYVWLPVPRVWSVRTAMDRIARAVGSRERVDLVYAVRGFLVLRPWEEKN
jgi:2-methylisocitrate lyase-like PEP mutase family enzyme